MNHAAHVNVIYPRMLGGEPGQPLLELASRDWLGDDPITAYRATAAQVQEAFHEPGALERTIDYGIEMPGSVLLGLRMAEFVVHGWDLARAVGADEHFDDDLAVVSWEEVFAPFIRSGDASSSMKPPIDLPANGPLERLLLGTGRTP